MKKIIAITFLSIVLLLTANAQDTLRNKKDGGYIFTVVKDLEATEVQNQNRTGTCWSFSALSFFESELIRMGKGKVNLSEMFIVRNAYSDKVEKYVRMHGDINLAAGGAFHDIPYIIKKYGIVPEEVYKGLNYGAEEHNHDEMDDLVKAMADQLIKKSKLTTAWKPAIESTLDAYLGAVPKEFEVKGKKYTPQSYANSLGLNMDDYVAISSFTHHPFYQKFILEVPDNWVWGSMYNVKLDEMMKTIDNAIMNGYTVAWASDVSEKGFSFKNGLAIVPEDPDKIVKTGEDNKNFSDAGADKKGSIFDAPGQEKVITQEIRQEAFDNFETTDDHGMHITGIVKDQLGNKYYIVKNSWGTKHNDCDGYFYASEAFVRYKTMNILVHKDAVPKDLAKKFQ
jgi:bleomycin hydrolase